MTTREMDTSSLEATLRNLRALPQTATRDQAVQKVAQQLKVARKHPLGSGDRFNALSTKAAGNTRAI